MERKRCFNPVQENTTITKKNRKQKPRGDDPQRWNNLNHVVSFPTLLGNLTANQRLKRANGEQILLYPGGAMADPTIVLTRCVMSYLMLKELSTFDFPPRFLKDDDDDDDVEGDAEASFLKKDLRELQTQATCKRGLGRYLPLPQG
ncbi:unnamed protein product [Microthlaspi erraticum]|uniref:Uncharacterized protein n=1 Tax=Microthlaspi erraticum TaxID=1685480 RepID=A0A6D2IMY8_9BRAS|nr:unnamed protein product [Microthlaspi erraticum]